MEIIERWKKILLRTFLLLSTATLGVGVYLHAASLQSSPEELILPSPSEVNTAKDIKEVLSASTSATISAKLTTIFIDVSGAVIQPRVYEIPIDSRLTIGLEEAGGLAKNADSAWVSKNLNLATKLLDGDKIYIPQKGEIKTQESILRSQIASKQESHISPPVESSEIAGITNGTIGITTEQQISSSPTVQAKTATVKTSNGKISVNTASASELDTLPGVGEITAKKIIDNRPYIKLEDLKEKKAVNRSTYEKILDKIEI